jgi:hypothetical protein
MSFFHSNFGFWSKLLIMELDSGSLAYSTRISSNQSRVTIVVAYSFTSSSFHDSASTTMLSFPFCVLFPYQKWKVSPSTFVVLWTIFFVLVSIRDYCDQYVLKIFFLRDIVTT